MKKTKHWLMPALVAASMLLTPLTFINQAFAAVTCSTASGQNVCNYIPTSECYVNASTNTATCQVVTAPTSAFPFGQSLSFSCTQVTTVNQAQVAMNCTQTNLT